MKYHGAKHDNYVYEYINHNKLHVIHELANYYFNRNNDDVTRYIYVIIEYF